MDNGQYVRLECGDETEISTSSLVDISLQAQLGKQIKKCRFESCEGVRSLTSFGQSANNCPTSSRYVVGPGHKPLSLIFKKTVNRPITKQYNIPVAYSKNVATKSSHALHLEELSSDFEFHLKDKLDYSPEKVTSITQPDSKSQVLYNQTKDTVVGQQSPQFQTNIVDYLTSRHCAEPLIQTCDSGKSHELSTIGLVSIDSETQSAKLPLTENKRRTGQESRLCIEKKKYFDLTHPVTDYLLSISSGSIGLHISFVKLRTLHNRVTETFYCATGAGLMEVFSTSLWRSAKSSDKSFLGSTNTNSYANTPSLLDILTDNSAASFRTSLELKCRDMIMTAISETNPTMFLDVESEGAYSSQGSELEGQAKQLKTETDNVDRDDKCVVKAFLPPLVTSAILEQKTYKDIPHGTPSNTTPHNDDMSFECVAKIVSDDCINSNLKCVTEVSLSANSSVTNTTEYLLNSHIMETTEVSINLSSTVGTCTKDQVHTSDIEVSHVLPATSVMDDHQNSQELPALPNLPTVSNTEALDVVHALEIEMSEACAMSNVPGMAMLESCLHSPVDNAQSPDSLCTTGTPEDLKENRSIIESPKEQVILPTKGITSDVLVVLPTQGRPTTVSSISLPTNIIAESSYSPTRGGLISESYTNSSTKVTTETPLSPRTSRSDPAALGPEFLPTILLTKIAINIPTKGIQEDSEFLLAGDRTEVHMNLPNWPDNTSQGPSLDRKYLEHSPLLFSEEEDDEIEEETSAESSLLDEIRTAEETRLHKLRKLVVVGGVLPPPSVTMPQLTAGDILELIRQNTPATATVEEPSPGSCQKMRPTYNSRLEQVTECVWPDAKQCCYPDIYYNNGSISEEFEALCIKYKERYVGNETASSCNLWCSLAPNSGKKRKRAGGPSPGRRLSHLASRRRQMFSKDNLFNISAANRELAAAERRKIYLDTKRIGQIQRSKSLLLEKARGRGDMIPYGFNAAPKVAHKRALFQSPDESKKYASTSKASAGYKNSDTGNNRSFKRALFSTSTEASGSHSNCETNQHPAKHDAVSKKIPLLKHRPMPTTSQQSPLRNTSKRKLTFPSVAPTSHTTTTSNAELKENNKVGTNHTTDYYTSSLDCSQRKKLMWALSQALRSVGIGTMHKLFRPSVQALGRVCKAPILEAVRNLKGHLSEVMLQVAMEHVAQVVEKKTSEFGASSTS